MSEDSKYKFRFGTYASSNPLYTEIRVETAYNDYTSSLGAGVKNSTISATSEFFGNPTSTTLLALTNSQTSSLQLTRDSNALSTASSIKYAFSDFSTSVIGSTSLIITLDCKCINATAPTAKMRTGFFAIRLNYKDEDGKSQYKETKSEQWNIKNKNWKTGDVIKELTLTLKLDEKFLKRDSSGKGNIPTSLEIIFKSYTKDRVVFSNLVLSYRNGGGTIPKNEYVFIKDTDGSIKYVYLCPWELKHVDSISVGVSGQSATMGIPNKPASRTQIFDTGGPVRTFKISGKRYDWEEEVNNWNFIYEQLNLANDSEYKDKKYTYVGMSWLLSNMQVLLKGYAFNISNSDPTDLRFMYKSIPTTSSVFHVSTSSALPSNSDGTYNDIFAYVDGERQFYYGILNTWKKYELPEDTCYNVALTAFNASFSETEPGLIEYSITLTERFKNGNNLYNVYKPLVSK